MTIFRFIVVVLALVAAVLVPACGPDPLVLPPAPDLQPLVQTYDMPSGTLDVTRAQDAVAEAEARLQASRFDWLAPLIENLLARLRTRLEASGFATDPSTPADQEEPIISGVVEINHTCRGLTDPPGPPDANANGSIDVTAVVEAGTLRRSIEGVATSCQERVPIGNNLSANVALNGSVTILLLGKLPGSVREGRFMVQVTGTASAAGEPAPAASTFDFRVTDGQLEFRLPRTDGDVIVSLGMQTITLRGSNGTFVCDRATRSCGTGSVSTVAGGQE